MSAVQPIIGITSDYSSKGDIFKGPAYFVGINYILAIQEAGGIPVILPYSINSKIIEKLIERIDGLVITGGNFDISSEYYGEKPIIGTENLNEERTGFEIEMARIGMERDMPILGICGGEQLLNVAGGGSLFQDIETQVNGASQHQQKTPKSLPHHPVNIKPGTKLHFILGCNKINVNSTHHQSIKDVGKRFVINAKAEDGIIEGIESTENSFVIGVQWHPEFLYQKEKRFHKLFQRFIKSCNKSLDDSS